MCFFLNLNMVRDKVRDKVELRTPPNTFFAEGLVKHIRIPGNMQLCVICRRLMWP